MLDLQNGYLKRTGANSMFASVRRRPSRYRQLVGLLRHHSTMALKGPTTNHFEIREWADAQGIVAVNIEPQRVDSEPARMGLLHKMTADETAFAEEMSWEEFFARLDLLRLSVVYDDATVFNEILEIDGPSPDALTPHAATRLHE